MVQNDIFLGKYGSLSLNSRFAVQNDATYLMQITRENCTLFLKKVPKHHQDGWG